MNEQPKDMMTIKETLDNLSRLLSDGQYSFHEEEVAALQSAIHHLEAGRRERELSEEALGWALSLIASEDSYWSNSNGYLMAERVLTVLQERLGKPVQLPSRATSELRLSRILSACSATAPTAQEAKETFCPGCGKPSNHMDAGTTSDHWGVWHSGCEKDFWMAGSGLDDEVPPFSRRKQP